MPSPTTSTSSTAGSSSSALDSTQSPSKHSQLIALPVALSIILFFILIIGALIGLRLRQRKAMRKSLVDVERRMKRSGIPRESTLSPLSPSHPAQKITPFLSSTVSSSESRSPSLSGSRSPGSSVDGPRFGGHVPGANMRIATRRADGVWIFSEPDAQTPFSPAGTAELIPTPSTRRMKEREMYAAERPKYPSSTPDPRDSYPIEAPPPAYSHPKGGGVLQMGPPSP